jgi:hypothetical protein
MDPDKTLEEIEYLCDGIQHCDYVTYSQEDKLADGERLAELTIALGEWVANGGYLPAKWSTAP